MSIHFHEEKTYFSKFSAVPWREAIDKCKSKGSYPIGNLNLSNGRSACKNLSNEGPGWIGVVRDQYIGQDQGKFWLPYIIIHSSFLSNIERSTGIKKVNLFSKVSYKIIKMPQNSEHKNTISKLCLVPHILLLQVGLWSGFLTYIEILSFSPNIDFK